MLIQWWFLNSNKKHFQVPTCLSFGAGIRISHANKWWCYKTSVLLVQFFLLGCYVPSNVFPTFSHISFCLSNGFFSTWVFTPVYHTRRMQVFAFNFKQWFYLSYYLFTCNSVTWIGKCFEFLNEMFGSIFVFFTVRYFNQNKWFTLSKKIRGNNKRMVIFKSDKLMYDHV